jgi:hypothetical protein
VARTDWLQAAAAPATNPGAGNSWPGLARVPRPVNHGRGGDVASIRLAEGLKTRGHVITIVSTKSVQKERFFQVKGFCPPNAKESFKKMDFLFGIPEKRPSLLIQGVQRSKYADKIQLLLCGQGEETEALRKMGAELPVKPFIQFITQEEKLTYLNTAALFVHGSIVELESLSSLDEMEAMYAEALHANKMGK